ncbi:MAG: hypothetical protein ABH825_04200, partial [Candidatus Omnitrophota bacterium]
VITTPVLTYNLQVMVNIFLSAFFMYLLAARITRDRIAAFLSGIIFGFCPYIFTRSWQHLGETYLWMMPFALWGLFTMREFPSTRNKALFICAIALSAISLNTMYYTAVIMAVFLVYLCMWLLRRGRDKEAGDKRFLKNALLVGGLAAAAVLIQIYPYLRKVLTSAGSAASAFNPYHRPFDDLFTQSAKFFSYLFPVTTHPVFGKFTEQFIGSPLYGVSYTEHALFLGWTPLVLAFIAFKNRRRERFYVGFFIWLWIAAWLFSQQPYFSFPAFKIYMPSFFMYKILPMFRAYCRFGIVVMLATAALAGFGFSFITSRLKNRVRIIAACAISLLVLFEFLNFPPYKVIDLTKYPKVYDWLKEQPGDFVIAEYPVDSKSPNEYYRFCQTIHEKKMINGATPGTNGGRLLNMVSRLSSPDTAGTLSWAGVKYVIVHRGPYDNIAEPEMSGELRMIGGRRIRGLEFMGDFDGVDVYKVNAPAIGNPFLGDPGKVHGG